MKVGVTRQLPLDVESLLSPFFEAVEVQERGRPLEPSELIRLIEDKDVLICQLTDLLTEKVLEHAKKLKHLATFSVGVDHIDLNALKRRGVRLSHTPGVLTEATANLAWGLILNCARHIKSAEKFLRDGKFNGFFPSLFLGLPLERSTLGIVGMGKIGRAVATRGKAFGMAIQYYTRTPCKDLPGKNVSFEELLSTSDVISLHCPLTPSTRHLVNATTLKKMKPSAILVNTARGPIIDENALYQHLKANPGFSVGLDVFEREPEVVSGLPELPNAICVPHIGSASLWAREQMAETCIKEAMRFACGEKLLYEYPL